MPKIHVKMHFFCYIKNKFSCLRYFSDTIACKHIGSPQNQVLKQYLLPQIKAVINNKNYIFYVFLVSCFGICNLQIEFIQVDFDTKVCQQNESIYNHVLKP